jgi:plastocyanin
MISLRTIRSSALSRLIAFAILAGLAAFVTVFTLASNNQSGNITTAKCSDNATCVYLQSDHAAPDIITVAVGGFIQFASADGKTHNLGLGEGDAHHDGSHKHEGSFVSGDFKADEAWRVQFKKTGTYKLHDHYRPDITVTVVVYDPNRSSVIK